MTKHKYDTEEVRKSNVGGAISLGFEAKAVITYSEFTENKNILGGALGIIDATVMVESSRFNGNQAVKGGAISLPPNEYIHTYLTIKDTEFTDNVGMEGLGLNAIESFPDDIQGGAIYAKHYAITVHSSFSIYIQTSKFIGNVAKMGGAISISGNVTLSIQKTSLENNLAIIGGGIFCMQQAKVDISGTIFINNSALPCPNGNSECWHRASSKTGLRISELSDS